MYIKLVKFCFEVLAAVIEKNTVIWDVMPYSPI
jgi:hypothetical protein